MLKCLAHFTMTIDLNDHWLHISHWFKFYFKFQSVIIIQLNFATNSGGHYKNFAIVSVNKHGHQVLRCPLGYTYSRHVNSTNGTWWRCNTTNKKTNDKSKRCQLRVRTKVIDGYEMIEMAKYHSHGPWFASNMMEYYSMYINE